MGILSVHGAPPLLSCAIRDVQRFHWLTENEMLIQHNQEIAQLSPDPFPLLRAGSGDETTLEATMPIETFGYWCREKC